MFTFSDVMMTGYTQAAQLIFKGESKNINREMVLTLQKAGFRSHWYISKNTTELTRLLNAKSKFNDGQEAKKKH
jgi:hypothetical protein